MNSAERQLVRELLREIEDKKKPRQKRRVVKKRPSTSRKTGKPANDLLIELIGFLFFLGILGLILQ